MEVAGTAATNFAVQIILARLLLPEEFGIVAMVAIFVNISLVVAQAGLGEALVQAKSITRMDVSTVFCVNLAVSAIMTAALWWSAPTIAAWYAKPILQPVLRALAFAMTISAVGESWRKVLIRNLDFRSSSLASVPGMIAGGTVGIVMALLGYGVWSLVGQRLAQAVVTSGLLLYVSPIYPAWEFSWQSAKRLLPFGSGIAGTRLVTILFENLYIFIVGTVYSFSELGFFTRAQAFQQFPSNTMNQISNRVLFSVFSSIQDSRDRLRAGMRQALVMTVLLAFPLMTFVGVAAESIVIVLLTGKWLPCVPYMKLFAIYGCLYPIHVINLNVMFAMGKSKLVFGLSFAKNAITILALLATYRHGISAIIVGQIVVSVISVFINAHYNKRLLAYSASRQLADVAPYALASLSAGALAFSCNSWHLLSPLALLILQSVVFLSAYFMVCYSFQLDGLVETIDLARRLRHHNSDPLIRA